MSRSSIRAAFAVLGAVTGLVLSAILNAPLGHEHSCPSGSAPTSCAYPPNLLAWRLEWLLGGLLVGLVLGAIAALVIGDRRRSRSVRRSRFSRRH